MNKILEHICLFLRELFRIKKQEPEPIPEPVEKVVKKDTIPVMIAWAVFVIVTVHFFLSGGGNIIRGWFPTRRPNLTLSDKNSNYLRRQFERYNVENITLYSYETPNISVEWTLNETTLFEDDGLIIGDTVLLDPNIQRFLNADLCYQKKEPNYEERLCRFNSQYLFKVKDQGGVSQELLLNIKSLIGVLFPNEQG